MPEDVGAKNVTFLFVVKRYKDDWRQLLKKWKPRKRSSKKLDLKAKKLELLWKIITFCNREMQLWCCLALRSVLSTMMPVCSTVPTEGCRFALSKAQFSHHFWWQGTGKMLFPQLLLLILVNYFTMTWSIVCYAEKKKNLDPIYHSYCHILPLNLALLWQCAFKSVSLFFVIFCSICASRRKVHQAFS